LKPRILEEPDHVYHAAPGISSSGLKRLLESPAHFKIPMKDSPAMKFGRAFHCKMLEPARFTDAYKMSPGFDRRTKDGKAAAAAFDLDLATSKAEIIELDDIERLEAMQRSALRNPIVSHLLTHADMKEQSIYVPEGGFVKKARADAVTGPVILDIKTIASAAGDHCLRAIMNHKYHLSAWWYLDLHQKAGVEVSEFVWAFVESTEPHGVRLYRATDQLLAIGAKEAKIAFDLYISCCESGSWPCYDADIIDAELPPYYARRYEHD
jgi:hypothetical protein